MSIREIKTEIDILYTEIQRLKAMEEEKYTKWLNLSNGLIKEIAYYEYYKVSRDLDKIYAFSNELFEEYMSICNSI